MGCAKVLVWATLFESLGRRSLTKLVNLALIMEDRKWQFGKHAVQVWPFVFYRYDGPRFGDPEEVVYSRSPGRALWCVS